MTPVPSTSTARAEQIGVVSAKPIITDHSLKPSHPSTKPSELREDPMWQDFDGEGLDGFVAFRPRNNFTVTFEGLDAIIDQAYDTLNSGDRNFSKHI